jgi:hypothetical protein
MFSCKPHHLNTCGKLYDVVLIRTAEYDVSMTEDCVSTTWSVIVLIIK